ncbi:MAG TPA: tyrosine-type recombinase/integrase [Thermoanaerobaculales bacterium]|nr:tyrosine-type recombinase/integrase [Thermoanaerobaculales bacterium]
MAQSKRPLKVTAARRLKPKAGKKRTRLWCSTTPGFHVEVTDQGHRSLYWQRKGPDGRSHRLKLCDLDEIEFDDARDLADRCNQALRTGKDPRIALRGDPEAMTVGSAWDTFLADTTWSERSVVENKYLFERHVRPVIGDRKIEDVTGPEVASLLAKAARSRKVEEEKRTVGGPVAANRTRAALSKLFTWAIERGLVESNPVAKTSARKETPRTRCLQPDEVQALIEAAPDGDTRDIIVLLLTTAARKGDVLGMRWSEVVLSGPSPRWTIPASRFKTRREHVVPLIPEAIEVLKRRSEDKKRDETFVFRSTSSPSHRQGFRKAWQKAWKTAKIEKANPHDLRRTVAQAGLDAGVDFAVVQATLGHSPNNLGITSVYAQVSIDRRRDGLQRAVDLLLGKRKLAKVVAHPSSAGVAS